MIGSAFSNILDFNSSPHRVLALRPTAQFINKFDERRVLRIGPGTELY
jgi:hypothetical protein